MSRHRARISGGPFRLAALAAIGLGVGGCVQLRQERLGVGEQPTLMGAPARDNRTPMDGALACLRKLLIAKGAPPLVIAVGDVRDYTGKFSVSEGNAITQGGALMVYSALGKLSGPLVSAERFDPTIAERELGYLDRRQLGDGRTHKVPGPGGTIEVPWLPYFGGSIAASNFYIVGGITELNYNIRSGGVETGLASIGPKARTFTQSVAIDLRIVDTRSLLVIKSISLTKQFSGYEVGFNIFRFFGSSLFDINVGAKGQEPLQLGIRTALEEATLRLAASVTQVDPALCLASDLGTIDDPLTALGQVATQAAIVGHAPGFAAIAAANEAGQRRTAIGSRFVLSFAPASSELAGAAPPTIGRIAAASHAGPVEVTLLAPGTEPSDPGARDALTDRRLATLVDALGARGVPREAVTLLWRPTASDVSTHRAGSGEQMLARLRIER